jgi:integrase
MTAIFTAGAFAKPASRVTVVVPPEAAIEEKSSTARFPGRPTTLRAPAGVSTVPASRASLARELRAIRATREPLPGDPVFCGLAGGRLQETILADIIRRATKRAGIEKHVTAHTLRHTAAAWLRQELGDTRLVAEYLGHADLSTVSRYAHVDRDELFTAAGRLEALAVRAAQ